MWQRIPDRTDFVDDFSGADLNQVEDNVEALKGGDPNVPPTISLEELSALRGESDGIATLGPDKKLLASQIPVSLLGVVLYKEAWDASLNEPEIPPASASNKGWYFVVSVEGNTEIDGISDWKVFDWIVSNGTSWQKIDNTETSGNMKKADYDPDEDGVVLASEKSFSEYTLCRNNSIVTIPKGTPVQISVYAFDETLVFLKASSIGLMPAHGLAAEDIPPLALGKIIRFGVLEDLDTSLLPGGSSLYVGEDGLSTVRPDPNASNGSQLVGKVLRSNDTTGKIFVYPSPSQGSSYANYCAGNDPRLSPLIVPIKATYSFDPGTILQNQVSLSPDIEIPGAELGDQILVSFSAWPGSFVFKMSLYGIVKTTNTVVIGIVNHDADFTFDTLPEFKIAVLKMP